MPAALKVPAIFEAIDKFTAPVRAMASGVDDLAQRAARAKNKLLGARFDQFADISKKAAITSALIAAPLVVAANNAIKFEDRMADVSKTTGLAGKGLEKFGEGILTMSGDTRTSIEELQGIAAIGGQMHVAEKDLLGFVDSANKFNVALGSDFGSVDEAVKRVSSLNVLFRETKSLRPDEAITKTGSAINALSSQGVNVPELNEFAARVGQLPDAFKPSIQSTLALGAVINKTGVTAEIASRAFGDIVMTAAKDLPNFAKQMGIGADEASRLLASDPVAFAAKFASSLNGLKPEVLAKKLKDLGLSDSGSIKTVGALAANTDMLAKFQGIANEEFAKGTSLLNEYNSKNETTAAKLERAKNNLEALSIVAGTEFLPVITDVLKSVVPVIKSSISWAKENKGLVKAIVIGVAVLASLAAAISLVTGAIALWTKAQMILNIVLTANPIGLIIAAIGILIALIVIGVAKWEEFGAAILVMLGPIGILINQIMSLKHNWDMIVEAFKSKGILSGILAIGKAFVDAILVPAQQMLGIISKLTGWEWATSAAKGIEDLRKEMGVAALNPEAEKQQAQRDMLKETVNSAKVDLNVNDPNNRASVKTDNPLVNIRTTSTMAFAN